MSFIILPFLYAFFFAFLTAYIASKKNYKIRSWFWLGFLLGFIATGILLFQPKKDGKSPE
jgi:cytochrome c biogenesis protein CcdA